MGHTVRSKFRAQVGLGSFTPYISPPLICVWSPRMNQGHKDRNSSGSPTGRYLAVERLINAPLKDALYLAASFSHHHYLTVSEPRWRAWQLPWRFIGFPASHLLNVIYSPIGSYKQFSLNLFFTFYILHSSNSLSAEHTPFVHSSSNPEHFLSLEPTISSLCLFFYSFFVFQFSLNLSLGILVQEWAILTFYL